VELPEFRTISDVAVDAVGRVWVVGLEDVSSGEHRTRVVLYSATLAPLWSWNGASGGSGGGNGASNGGKPNNGGAKIFCVALRFVIKRCLLSLFKSFAKGDMI